MATFVKTHKESYDALSKFVQTQPLKDKSVIITGAGRGVGEHITKAIAAAGARRVAIIGRDKRRIEDAQFRYSREFSGVEFVAYAADIVDAQSVSSAVDDFGQADILVNNAGHFPDEAPFVKENLASWFSGFQINVLGTAIVTQAFLKSLPTGAEGIVLNFSSIAAHLRFPLTAWSGYCGSKMAQARVFEMIRFEHPDVRFINCHPGSIASDGFDRSGAPAPPEGMTDGKLAGEFFVWLASGEAQFLTGRFVWAEWDIDELKDKKAQIIDQDLLLTTVDGFSKGLF